MEDAVELFDKIWRKADELAKLGGITDVVQMERARENYISHMALLAEGNNESEERLQRIEKCLRRSSVLEPIKRRKAKA